MAEDMSVWRDLFIYMDHPKLKPESKVGDIVEINIGANIAKYKLKEKFEDGFQSEWCGWVEERDCKLCFHYHRLCKCAINKTVMIENCMGYKTNMEGEI